MKAERPAAAPVVADPRLEAAMRTWFRFLRLHRRITTRAARELRAVGLSIPQFDLLSVVWEREGLSQQDVAERLYVTKGNVSGLVDRLAAADLVERRALPDDRRSYALFLTEKGREVVETGFRLQRELVAATLGDLPEGTVGELDATLVQWRDRVRALPPLDD